MAADSASTIFHAPPDVKYPYIEGEALGDLPSMYYVLEMFLVSHMVKSEICCQDNDTRLWCGLKQCVKGLMSYADEILTMVVTVNSLVGFMTWMGPLLDVLFQSPSCSHVSRPPLDHQSYEAREPHCVPTPQESRIFWVAPLADLKINIGQSRYSYGLEARLFKDWYTDTIPQNPRGKGERMKEAQRLMTRVPRTYIALKAREFETQKSRLLPALEVAYIFQAIAHAPCAVVTWPLKLHHAPYPKFVPLITMQAKLIISNIILAMALSTAASVINIRSDEVQKENQGGTSLRQTQCIQEGNYCYDIPCCQGLVCLTNVGIHSSLPLG
ncbi:hypothetical protein DXG01_011572 [Tephrocybe rancida]|nr:hypothetical protein DXG01_011572 [Tephrocybe rancida]